MRPEHAAELPFGTDIIYQGKPAWFAHYDDDCLINADGEYIFVDAEEIEELRSDNKTIVEVAVQPMLGLREVD